MQSHSLEPKEAEIGQSGGTSPKPIDITNIVKPLNNLASSYAVGCRRGATEDLLKRVKHFL